MPTLSRIETDHISIENRKKTERTLKQRELQMSTRLTFNENIRKIIFGILAIFGVATSAHTEEMPFYLPEKVTHLIKSKNVDQTFAIHIIQPIQRKDGSERFPVIYSTDASGNIGALTDISRSLQRSGLANRYILVGIGYPEDQYMEAVVRRARDLSKLPEPPRSQAVAAITEAPKSLVEGAKRPDIRNLHDGADDFLAFIHKELMPYIEASYPVIPEERTYFGYSAGGRFGWYTLFNRPETFSQYIIGSSAVSFFGHDVMVETAKAYVASGKPLNAKIFHSVGAEEHFEPAYAATNFGTGFYEMAKLMKNAKNPGLNYSYKMFPGEVHATAWLPTFVYGVQHMFGPADCLPYVANSKCDKN